jgi:hypothetical protein
MISDAITEEQNPDFETWDNRVNSLSEFISENFLLLYKSTTNNQICSMLVQKFCTFFESFAPFFLSLPLQTICTQVR